MLNSLHGLVLKGDGSAWGWGANSWGQLGIGISALSNVPVAVSTLTGVVDLAASDMSVALTSDGRVWQWGRGNALMPTLVSSLANVVAVEAGWPFGLALRSDGTVWAWPFGGIPVAVNNLTGVAAISGGGGRSALALKRDGTVWEWFVWETGDPVPIEHWTPWAVPNLAEVVAIAGGGEESLALKRDGSVWAWGVNDGVPGPVLGLTGVTAIAAGAHSMALRADGTVWAWGQNDRGQLGDGTNVDSDVPVAVKNLTGVKAISVCFHSLALKNDGTVWAWGGNVFGELGDGTNHDSNVPVAVKGLTNAGAIAAGYNFSLAALFDPPPVVAVVTPNGGEKLYAGSSHRIEWRAFSGVRLARFDVQYSLNAGSSFQPVPGCTGLAGWSRSCVWPAPGPVTAAGRIRVVAYDIAGETGSDTSDANFSIASGKPSITVTAPNTAVNWALGSQQLIKWNHNLGPTSLVKLDVTKDGGSTWKPIADAVPNKGTFPWTVTGPATRNARIRVSWSANTAVMDVSNTNFTIAAPFITVKRPNGGEQWKQRSTQTITWASNLGSKEFVKIDLSTDGGSSWLSLAEATQASVEGELDPLSTLIGSTPSDGIQNVVMPAVKSNKCGVRITWLDNPAVRDVSNANFAIIP